MEKYKSWIDRAKSSYELARSVVNNNVYFEDRCFQIQQAAEKVLKGLLIYFGVEPEYTHNIGLILNELEKHVEITDDVKKAIKLTNYAVQTRYPGIYNEVTEDEYKEALIIAKNCLDWVEKTIENKVNGKI